MTRKGIIRFWVAVAALLAALATAAALAWYWPSLFPSRYVSDIYKDYADSDGIQATFVMDYRVDDTLRIDATILQALSDSAWEALEADFDIKPLPPDVQAVIDGGHDLQGIRHAPKDNPRRLAPTQHDDDLVLIISYLNRSIHIFHTTTKDELLSVTHAYYEKNINRPIKNNPQ